MITMNEDINTINKNDNSELGYKYYNWQWLQWLQKQRIGITINIKCLHL